MSDAANLAPTDCVQQGRCEAENVDVVRCAWNGGHGMYGSLAPLIWEFFQAHPKEVHEDWPSAA
jgi:hypothetical protein